MKKWYTKEIFPHIISNFFFFYLSLVPFMSFSVLSSSLFFFLLFTSCPYGRQWPTELENISWSENFPKLYKGSFSPNNFFSYLSLVPSTSFSVLSSSLFFFLLFFFLVQCSEVNLRIEKRNNALKSVNHIDKWFVRDF